MSWTRITPIAPAYGKAMVTATVSKTKGRGLICKLGFAETFLQDYKNRERCYVSIGTNDYAGKVLVEFHPEGDFKVHAYGKGGGYIILSAEKTHIYLDREFPQLNCKTEAGSSKDVVVILLPVEQWRDIKLSVGDGQRALPAPPKKPEQVNGVKPAHPPADEKSNVEASEEIRIDAVSYLSKKGFKISRNNDGTFNIGGDVYPRDKIMSQINVSRKHAGLDSIRDSDFF